MRFVDFDGQDHVKGESDSLAILSDDERCRWGFDKNGIASLSIDNQTVMEATVEMQTPEGKWLPLPYRPVPIQRILYRKTYAMKEWKVSLRADNNEVITDQATKWEVGMALKARTNTTRIYAQSKIQVPLEGQITFEVLCNLPIRVHIKTKQFDKTFYRDGRFLAGIG